MERRFCILIILFAAAFSASAQQGISGRVAIEATGDPKVGSIVWAIPFPRDPDGAFLGRGSRTDASGNYFIRDLPSRTYFVYIDSSDAFDYPAITEVYDDIQCDVRCKRDQFEELYQDQATLVTVDENLVTEQINFELSLGASINGRLVDDLSGAPITGGPDIVAVGITVDRISDPFAREIVSNTFSFDDGSFQVPEGLVPGSYVLRFAAAFRTPNYISELFDNQQCYYSCDVAPPSCNLYCDYGFATQINIIDPQAEVELVIGMEPSGVISGMVTDAVTGEPFARGDPNSAIELYDTSGAKVNDFAIFHTGAYRAAELRPGVYYARAKSSYSSQLYQNQDCPSGSCNVTNGTPIDVQVGDETTDINFSLIGDTVFIGDFESPQAGL